MNCPNDGTQLDMTERAGIEVDYCPSCRGVWLDRGELDKIIDRSNAEVGQGRDDHRERRDHGARDDRDDRDHRDDRPRAKKKRSFLSELFEQ